MQHKLIMKLRIFDKLKAKLVGMFILVEGKRDVKALIQARIGNPDSIIAINSQKMEKVASRLIGKDVAVLTDYDRTGEIKAREAYEELLSQGARPDMECRRTLRHVLGLYRIEEINTSIRDFEEKLEMIRDKIGREKR
jgi:5S rRNA maturation endonuclease (ribonuclease M5)